MSKMTIGEDDDKDGICVHDFVNLGTQNATSNCKKCGFQNNNDQVLKSRQCGIQVDLETLNFSNEIKIKANNIAVNIGDRITRKRARKRFIFFCIYSAYGELNLIVDPREVAKEVGITLGDMPKALSTYSKSQTGYKRKSHFLTPDELIPGYCSKLNLTGEFVKGAVEFSKKIVSKDPSLMEIYPQNVAVGILYYYAIINSYQIDLDVYSKIFAVSKATIKNINKQVALAHNQ